MVRSKRPRKRTGQQRSETARTWRKVDLHLHTPGSADYQQGEVRYIHILQRAEECGLDIIAFTDHNTVSGYARMWREIEDLELLEALERLQPEEAELLSEYRRLLNQILVLPGFEFTATFGFHILAIFPEDTSIRQLEHTLLNLNVPEDRIEMGTSEVGATTDVLQAYEIMNEAGALVIGAHVNSTHGIAMRDFPFGGQTKIAYTQSPSLHALEATDLGSTSRRATARFFNGSKPEYSRRMHCIQGSDAHRLFWDREREKDLGVGDRPTELLLEEVSFKGLRELFESNDFSRTRPGRPAQSAADFVQNAREDGPGIAQAFHERLATRRTKSNAVIRDISALANANGGVVFIGLDGDPEHDVVGVTKPDNATKRILEEVEQLINPELEVTIETHVSKDKDVLAISVPEGSDKPYALTTGEIFIRRDTDTVLASRDDIVELVRSSLAVSSSELGESGDKTSTDSESPGIDPTEDTAPVPNNGVEIIGEQQKDGTCFYAMRDLRNNKVVQNVTRDSAKRLWRYAITQRENRKNGTPEQIKWNGRLGFVRAQKQRGAVRYDLAYKENGSARIFYGVTEDGLDDDWKAVIADQAPGNGDGKE